MKSCPVFLAKFFLRFQQRQISEQSVPNLSHFRRLFFDIIYFSQYIGCLFARFFEFSLAASKIVFPIFVVSNQLFILYSTLCCFIMQDLFLFPAFPKIYFCRLTKSVCLPSHQVVYCFSIMGWNFYFYPDRNRRVRHSPTARRLPKNLRIFLALLTAGGVNRKG